MHKFKTKTKELKEQQRFQFFKKIPKNSNEIASTFKQWMEQSILINNSSSTFSFRFQKFNDSNYWILLSTRKYFWKNYIWILSKNVLWTNLGLSTKVSNLQQFCLFVFLLNDLEWMMLLWIGLLKRMQMKILEFWVSFGELHYQRFYKFFTQFFVEIEIYADFHNFII